METVLPILGTLALVACSGLVGRHWPRVPLPLLQIAAGALLGWPAAGLHLQLQPQIFMLLFIPPMLFADGWEMPKREFGHYKWAILLLSTVLVLLTVVVLGYCLHWVLPGMPLSVAFVLAAVLSPTDAVAVSAIVQRLNMPAKLQHILEGEALTNDASALIAVKFAVAATLTASFSLPNAVLDFVGAALGGALVGAVFSWLFKLVHDRFLHWRENQAIAPTVLLLLLMPFVPYLIAEHYGLSGVLAAVAAGMTASAFDVRSSRFNAIHMQTQSTWEIVRFAFNGLIFTLVGLQVAELLRHPPALLHGGAYSAWSMAKLFTLGMTIAALLVALRFGLLASGAWLARRFLPARASARAGGSSSLAAAALVALGGTRGGITLAAVLSVPLVLLDGRVFPARDLLVFLATMVVVMSLVVAGLGLPWLLGRVAQPEGVVPLREQAWARNRASRAALRMVESAPMPLEPLGAHREVHPHAHERLVAVIRSRVHHGYSNRLRMAANDPEDRHLGRVTLGLERQLRLQALQSERSELHRLCMSRRINDETLRALTREIDLEEMTIRCRPQT